MIIIFINLLSPLILIYLNKIYSLLAFIIIILFLYNLIFFPNEAGIISWIVPVEGSPTKREHLRVVWGVSKSSQLKTETKILSYKN